MVMPDRLLMGPGPTNPYPEVTAAFAQPLLGHLDPEFLRILDETCDRLRAVFGTANALTLPISGTGSAGMEACFVNLVEPGDSVIVGVNGVFGERMCEVARRAGAEVVRVDAGWGTPIDPQALLDALAAHPGARALAVVHAETSTGVENDVAALRPVARHRHPAARRLGHVARRHPAARRRVGDRRLLLGHTEVSGCAPRVSRRSRSRRARSTASAPGPRRCSRGTWTSA